MVGDARVDRPRRTGRRDRPVAQDVVELLRRMADRVRQSRRQRVEPRHARSPAPRRGSGRRAGRADGGSTRTWLARWVSWRTLWPGMNVRWVATTVRSPVGVWTVATRAARGSSRTRVGHRLPGQRTACATTTQRQVEHLPRAHREAAQQRDPVARPTTAAGRRSRRSRRPARRAGRPRTGAPRRPSPRRRRGSGRRRASAAGPGRPPAGRARRRRGRAPRAANRSRSTSPSASGPPVQDVEGRDAHVADSTCRPANVRVGV